ncbi:MAG: secondary thiamine-phosphate synthase enzyme YjbQ [Bacteriovoracaceae bacterium]
MKTVTIKTHGEQFYSITKVIEGALAELAHNENGVLYIYCPHTSCGLALNESFETTAVNDMQEFLKHLAPRNLKFITHTSEGPDDSPSHMKSLLIQNSLTIFVEQGRLKMGQWQGLYLCEFRDAPKERKMWLKFIKG